MFLFLTVSLLLLGDSTQQITEGSGFIIPQLNLMRARVAGGLLNIKNLPSSASMFTVNNNETLEFYSMMVTYNCRRDNIMSSIVPASLQQSFYSSSLSNSSAYVNAFESLRAWQKTYLPPTDNPSKSVGNVIYNDESMKEFANMFYYKLTEAGCSYKECNASAMFAVACVFSSAPQLGEPVYIASQNGGCSKDSDCSEYLPHSKCATVESGREFQGLCYAGNVTTFSSSTTTTTTTTASTTTFPSPMTSAIRLNIINMHNYRRSRLAQGLVPNGLSGQYAPSGANIYSMMYSTDLENDAQKYADNCPTSGSSLISRNSSGENFGIVSSSTVNSYYDAVSHALQSFWHVIKSTSINNGMTFTPALAGDQALLRFTQMAWATTYQVGCGAKLCNGNYVVVCRYNPRGNILWENIYETGTTCGSCPDICTTAYMYRGLCAAPN